MKKKNILLSKCHITSGNTKALVAYYLGENFHQTKDLPECVVINERDFSGRLREIFPPVSIDFPEEWISQRTIDMQSKSTVIIFKGEPLFDEVKEQALNQIERWAKLTWVKYN